MGRQVGGRVVGGAGPPWNPILPDSCLCPWSTRKILVVVAAGGLESGIRRAGRRAKAAGRRVVRPVSRRREARSVARFHRLYYESEVWQRTFWMGRQILKCPLDLWIYAEIIQETRPQLIVETGTYAGASALYFAHMLDLAGAEGRVITIDLDDRQEVKYPKHPRIEYLLGRSSVDPDVIEAVRRAASGKRTMVVLDSAHHADHVRAELEAYAELVTTGCYLIVEDTCINGNPVVPWYGPGPREALLAWDPSRHGFTVDTERERLLLTFNPGGYLRRTS
jgi:cephalosporin hydroxylase